MDLTFLKSMRALSYFSVGECFLDQGRCQVQVDTSVGDVGVDDSQESSIGCRHPPSLDKKGKLLARLWNFLISETIFKK